MSLSGEVCILAGGWSVRDICIKHLPGKVIAVNDAAIYAKCDYIVSMDRLWSEYRWGKLKELNLPTFLRRSAVQNLNLEAEGWSGLSVFDCDNQSTFLSSYENVLNGSNSGFCALNLAYKLKPKKIYLLGFDMSRGPKGETYWYPSYPWSGSKGGATSAGKYREWAKQFEGAARQFKELGIEVLNVTRKNPIEAFRKIQPQEFSTCRV